MTINWAGRATSAVGLRVGKILLSEHMEGGQRIKSKQGREGLV